MKAVFWTDPAIADLRSIDDYWSALSNAAAVEIADKIKRAATLLIDYSRAGADLQQDGARKCGVQSTRYLLVYRVADQGIEVLRVYHSSQDRDDR